MKAVVLENKNGYAAVLTEDGSVEKLRGVYTVGNTIEVQAFDFVHSGNTVRFRGLRRSFAAVAAALLLSVSGLSYYTMTAQAYSTVTVEADADASIQYILNRFDKVIGMEVTGESAEGLLEELEQAGVRKKGMEEALSLTEGILEKRGFLQADTDPMQVQVSSRNEARGKMLEQRVEDTLREAGRLPGETPEEKPVKPEEEPVKPEEQKQENQQEQPAEQKPEQGSSKPADTQDPAQESSQPAAKPEGDNPQNNEPEPQGEPRPGGTQEPAQGSSQPPEKPEEDLPQNSQTGSQENGQTPPPEEPGQNAQQSGSQELPQGNAPQGGNGGGPR